MYMNTLNTYFVLISGFAFFYYGMIIVSDGTQTVLSGLGKTLLNPYKHGPLISLIGGVGLAVISQSSSVIIIMALEFVNAGLFSIVQAASMVLGASFGTALTPFFFAISLKNYAFVPIAIGVIPLVFTRHTFLRQLGRLLLGVGFVYFGLNLFYNTCMITKFSFQIPTAFIHFAFIFLLASIITFVTKYSVISIGIVMMLGKANVIDMTTALILVLGINFGSTLNSLWISQKGDHQSKQVAIFNCLIHFFGIVLFTIFFPLFKKIVLLTSPENNIPIQIAISHLFFNFVLVVIFYPTKNLILNFIDRTFFKDKGKSDNHLIILGELNNTPAALISIQAHQGILKFKDILERMFEQTMKYLKTQERNAKQLGKIKHYEHVTDNMKKEIEFFTERLMEKKMTPQQAKKAQAILRLSAELEKIADCLDNIVTYKTRFFERSKFSGEMEKELVGFADKVWQYYQNATNQLSSPHKHNNQLIENQHDQLIKLAQEIRSIHMDRIDQGDQSLRHALTYLDVVVPLKKICEHSLNISQTLNKLV